MRVISAPRQAAIADAGPVEKFNIAGTRPSAWRAKNVISEARDVGSSRPTRSPGRVLRASTEPSAKLPVTSPR